MSNSPDEPTATTTKSNDWRLVYANTFGLMFGDNDVRLTIGLDQDIQKPGTEVLEQLAIMMTPRTAKLLAHTLSSVVANFEVANGPISLPQGRIEKIDAALQEQSDTHKKTTESAKAKK